MISTVNTLLVSHRRVPFHIFSLHRIVHDQFDHRKWEKNSKIPITLRTPLYALNNHSAIAREDKTLPVASCGLRLGYEAVRVTVAVGFRRGSHL